MAYLDHKSAGIDAIFPSMRTDVVLGDIAGARRIVIDTTFNAIITKGWHRDDTLRSGYIYQIYAYLRSQEGRGDPMAETASGLFLHPSIGQTVNEAVVIQGHEIRFATIDLAGDANEIRRSLLDLVGAEDQRPS